jgi:hypothetical protein
MEIDMNSYYALALVLAAAAAGNVRADDITIDPNPFVSTASRAEVMADLQQFQQSGVNPWADDYNQLSQMHGTKSREQVKAEFLAERDQVSAMDAEDSGSSYLARVAAAKARPGTTELARSE